MVGQEPERFGSLVVGCAAEDLSTHTRDEQRSCESSRKLGHPLTSRRRGGQVRVHRDIAIDENEQGHRRPSVPRRASHRLVKEALKVVHELEIEGADNDCGQDDRSIRIDDEKALARLF